MTLAKHQDEMIWAWNKDDLQRNFVRTSRLAAHKRGLVHEVARTHVVLVNKFGVGSGTPKLVVKRYPYDFGSSAGLLCASAGGHVGVCQNTRLAAQREVEEELFNRHDGDQQTAPSPLLRTPERSLGSWLEERKHARHLVTDYMRVMPTTLTRFPFDSRETEALVAIPLQDVPRLFTRPRATLLVDASVFEDGQYRSTKQPVRGDMFRQNGVGARYWLGVVRAGCLAVTNKLEDCGPSDDFLDRFCPIDNKPDTIHRFVKDVLHPLFVTLSVQTPGLSRDSLVAS